MFNPKLKTVRAPEQLNFSGLNSLMAQQNKLGKGLAETIQGAASDYASQLALEGMADGKISDSALALLASKGRMNTSAMNALSSQRGSNESRRKESFRAGENSKSRTHSSNENSKSRAFSAGESEKSRTHNTATATKTKSDYLENQKAIALFKQRLKTEDRYEDFGFHKKKENYNTGNKIGLEKELDMLDLIQNGKRLDQGYANAGRTEEQKQNIGRKFNIDKSQRADAAWLAKNVIDQKNISTNLTNRIEAEIEAGKKRKDINLDYIPQEEQLKTNAQLTRKELINEMDLRNMEKNAAEKARVKQLNMTEADKLKNLVAKIDAIKENSAFIINEASENPDTLKYLTPKTKNITKTRINKKTGETTTTKTKNTTWNKRDGAGATKQDLEAIKKLSQKDALTM
jgi:hypothetical protein